MSELGLYLRKAKASKATGYDLPIIASAEDAVRVVREAGEKLADLSPAQRLAVLSDLKEISTLLQGQMHRLDNDITEIRDRLGRARSSRQACSSYARSAFAGRRH